MRGVTVFTLLGVAFIILRLCHVIDWSWLWVLAPFWGGFLVGALALIVAVVLALVEASKK